MKLLRVVHIHRKKKPGAFSIETIFKTVANELRNQVEMIEYELGSKSNIMLDLFNLRSLEADVYHITGDVNYLIPFLPHGKTVLTIHDIGHYLFDLKGIKRWIYRVLWLDLPILRATIVTTISNYSAENIIDNLGIDRVRIKIIENCYSSSFINKTKKFNNQYPVILQIGTEKLKNVPKLIEALNGIKCKLILIGNIDELIKEKLIRYEIDFENKINLSQDEIVQLYLDSDVVTFISLGEGFGVPIIEAQASGRPLITSNVSPMSDVAGNGSCQVSPNNTDEIRKAIIKIISDQNYRESIIQMGLKNSINYSPSIIANKYHNLYKLFIK
jgi:glycosyltransferase involved in cell wall biosynthesis